MNRKMICATLAALLFLGGVQLAHAEMWDAYTDYAGTQSATSVWQYLDMDGQGTNGPYTTMAVYQEIPYNGYLYQLWDRNGSTGNYFGKIAGFEPDLRSDFGQNATNVLAWRSPIDGFVDLTFAVRKQAVGGDGADYVLYQDNNSTPVVSGTVAYDSTDASLNTHSLTNIPVSVGSMFYLQTSVGTSGDPSYDTLGVTFTVTSVPEPGTLVLLSGGLAGLLAFVWRKRK